MSDSRSITRSTRIPIDIDDKIVNHCKERRLNYTDGILDLIQTGLRVNNIKNEIDVKPELEKEIQKECEGSLRSLIEGITMSEETKKISTNQLKLAIMKCSVELDRRKKNEEERLTKRTVHSFHNSNEGNLDWG